MSGGNSTGEGGREYRKGKQEHHIRAGRDTGDWDALRRTLCRKAHRRHLTNEAPDHYNIKQEVMDMLDEKDLQAIQTMIDGSVKESESRMMAYFESAILPKFNLLADGQSSILEKLVPRSRVDDLENEVMFLKSIIRQMNEDLQKLKKAQ